MAWLDAERQAAPADEPEALLRARTELSGPVTTAAHEVLGGAEAPPWLARRWLAPARALALLRTLPDRRLPRWLQGLEATLDADVDRTPQAIAWLPAWLLVEQPLLLEPLSLAQPVGDSECERGLRLMATLLRLERAGRHAERMQCRRELQQLQPQLFAAYMKTR